MSADGGIFLRKALESIAGAASELLSDRQDNCANRCYFACFQAAIHALIREGVRPRGASSRWSHDFVQAEFASQLINRRKLYPANLRSTLSALSELRATADYAAASVSSREASRALREARLFVDAIRVRSE